MEKYFTKTHKNKSVIKDVHAKKLRKFCRAIERNMNNYVSLDKFHDPNRSCTGFFLKLDSVNGIKKVWKGNQIPKDKNFYLRFYLTFFNPKMTQFFGNTYKSPLLSVKFNESGHYELSDEPLYVYFLANPSGGLSNSAIGGVNNQGGLKSSTINTNVPNQCVVEVVFVETNLNNYVLSQSCEGWGILDIREDTSSDIKPISTAVYMGTPRSLLNKGAGSKNLYPIGGASIIYSCSIFKELQQIKFLLPNYIIFGHKESLPGLLFNYLPKKPILNEPLKLVEFSDIYLKNVEIEVSPNLESRLIYYASMYRKQKYEIADDSVLSPIVVKERKIRCGVHNTFTFINSSGLENFVSLTRRENTLFFKGVHHIDNYFNNENCAFILELSYTLSLPGPKNQREDILSMIIGYAILIPEKIDMDNTFRAANLITGPGVTIYGEYLYDPVDSDDKVIKVNFILTKNKDNFDKTYKEKEIEDLKGQMEFLKRSMMDDYNKMLTNKDKEKEDLLRKRETELEEMEAKLRESQRGLKTVYDKDDVAPSKIYSETYNSKPKTHSGFNNQKFIVDDQFGKADENMVQDEDHDRSNIKYVTDHSHHSLNQIDDNYEKDMIRRGSKKPTVVTREDVNANLNYNNTDHENENDQETKNKFIKTNTRYESVKVFNEHMMNMNTNPNMNMYNTPNNYDDYNFYKMFFMKFKNNLDFDPNREEEMNKHLPKIIYDQSSKDIPRGDKADLIAKGLLSLDSSEKSENILNYTLEKELKDDKKAHSFTFQFLAFKPNSEIKDYNSIPDKIFFRFNFWDFEYFSTNVATVCKPNSNSNIIPSSTPLILQRENSVLTAKSGEKEMKIQIDYDPSTDPLIDYKDFISFLLNKQLFVEIYEAEKLFFIGYIKLPLRDLLRQGKPSIFLTREYEIYDEKFKSKGYLQVLLKSVGVSTQKAFIYDPAVLKVINTKDRFTNLPKKKKVRSKPLDINKIQQQEKEILAKTLISDNTGGVSVNSIMDNNNRTLKLNVDDEMQKRLRAMKYVNQSSSNPILVPEERLEQIRVKQEKEDQFYKTLNYANKLKEMKKKEILSKVMQDNNKNSLTISLVTGQPFFSNFIIHNNTEHDELLHVHVTKTSDENLKNPENSDKDTITIINNSEDWKNLTEKHSLIKPNDYNSLSPQNYFVLKPNESFPLLIKILSFNENLSNSNFCVYVTKKSGEPLYLLSVTIVKVFPIIDHVFKYLLPENRFSTVKIPNPFKYDKMKVGKVLDNYICTDVLISLQLDPTSNDLYFKTKVQSEGHKNDFYLFLYMDALRSVLYSTWKFEITSMSTIDVHAQIGTKITQKLTLEVERNSRTVQFFSNNNDILYFAEKCNSPIILVPNMTNEIKYILYPKKEENYEIVVNCVDISSRELIKSWMVRIMPDKPQINHVHKIDCRVNSVTNIRYEFTNTLNSWVIFNFESNNPDLLNVVDSRLPFNAGEKKLINISIPAQTQMGRAEVLVFVSETEETYSETILFQLNFK